jgi:hypothetical protein
MWGKKKKKKTRKKKRTEVVKGRTAGEGKEKCKGANAGKDFKI